MESRQGLPALNHLLQHTLRSLCTDSQWVYAVFWRILPRNYPPPQWETEGGPMDRSKGNKRNWILVWEDGFCNFSACAKEPSRGGTHFFAQHRSSAVEDESDAMNPELFFKMSHEVYNYGEGLMGKVAADSSHKWVYREPMEHEISFLSPWHGSLDPHPRTWEHQFKSGIQTIAVVAVQEGVLQLGSTKKIMEELNFVLHMQRKFNYLQSIPGVFVPHPSSTGGGGRRRNGEGSPPAERGHWMPVAVDVDRPMRPSSHLPARSIDQILSPRIGPDVWRFPLNTTDTTILGVKRPPDSVTLSLNFKDYPYMSNGGFECRPECPSPPKTMNTGQGSPQGGASPTIPNLLPSMSSLQALLSKLPSVTPMEGEAKSGGGGTTSPSTSSGFEGPGQNFSSYSKPPLSRSMSKGSAGAGQERAPPVEAHSNRQANGHAADVTQGDVEPAQGNRTSNSSNSGVAAMSPPSSTSDVMSSEHREEDLSRAEQQQGDIQSKDHPKYSSFLDTFDTLSDFSLQDALESGDSYNSFLNEIY